MRKAGERLTRCFACALALALWYAPACGSPPLQLPTSPLQNYYLEQRAIGAQSSEALAEAILYTAKRAPDDRRVALAEQASLVAPALAEPHLLRGQWLLRRFDVAGAFLALRDAWLAVSSDAVQSAKWSLRVLALVQRTLLGALLALAIILLLRSLTFLKHVLSARTSAPRAILLILCSLAALAIIRFPILGSLVVLALVAPFLARRERSVLGLLCLLMGAAAFMLQWQKPDALLADPGHRLNLLARANTETLPTAQVRRLESTLETSRERSVVLGLQAARRQQWHESHQHYVEALAQDSTWATTYVNLANLFFALDDFERAATGYRTAQSLAPNSPYPHANLAQAYIQMLQYEQSDHELRMASSLGFDAANPQRAAWKHESLPIAEARLTRQDLRSLAHMSIEQEPAVAAQRIASWGGPGWNGLRLQWMPWVLFSMAILFLLRIRLAKVAFECAECKRVTCRHCVPEEEDSGLFCPRCEMIAIRRTGNSMGDGTAASRRPSYAQTADRAPTGIAILFPGAAYLLLRAPGMAIGTVLLACAALNLASAWLSAVLFLSLYLPGLLRLRHKPRPVGA